MILYTMVGTGLHGLPLVGNVGELAPVVECNLPRPVQVLSGELPATLDPPGVVRPRARRPPGEAHSVAVAGRLGRLLVRRLPLPDCHHCTLHSAVVRREEGGDVFAGPGLHVAFSLVRTIYHLPSAVAQTLENPVLRICAIPQPSAFIFAMRSAAAASRATRATSAS